MSGRPGGPRVPAALVAISCGLLAACGSADGGSSSTLPSKSEQDCPLIRLPVPTPVAVIGEGGTAATMVQQLDGLDLVEAELLRAVPCSFSELVVTPDQRGFAVYATELSDEERALVESIVDGIEPGYELRGIEQARAARPEVEQAKQRVYAAVPLDVEISLSSDQMGDITIWVSELPDRPDDAELIATVEDSVTEVDADFAGEIRVVEQEPFVSGAVVAGD